MIRPQKFFFFPLKSEHAIVKTGSSKTGVNTEIQKSVNRRNDESVWPGCGDEYEVVYTRTRKGGGGGW